MANAMARRDAVNSNGSAFFRDDWIEQMYPEIRIEYDALRLVPASRMTAKHEKEPKDKEEHKGHAEHKDDAEIIRDKLVAVLDEVRVKTERRNVYANLAWTHPSANTTLHVNSTYDKVANLALDMFCDTSGVLSAEALAASAKGDETETQSPPRGPTCTPWHVRAHARGKSRLRWRGATRSQFASQTLPSSPSSAISSGWAWIA